MGGNECMGENASSEGAGKDPRDALDPSVYHEGQRRKDRSPTMYAALSRIWRQRGRAQQKRMGQVERV